MTETRDIVERIRAHHPCMRPDFCSVCELLRTIDTLRLALAQAEAVVEAAKPVANEFAQQHPLIKALRDALSASPRDGLEDRPTDGEGWQLIETAPKDGHRILLSGVMQGVRWTAVAHWASRQRWEDDSDDGFTGNATHWQPLPAPPSSASPQTGNEE